MKKLKQNKGIEKTKKSKKEIAKKELNQTEYFDVLDENGNYTGKILSREEVHKTGAWHKSIHIFIINDKKQLLMQRRAKNKKRGANKLDISCTGHLTAGDTSKEGALRELDEELGIKVKEEELIFCCTVKRSYKKDDYIDNEFNDIYFLNKQVQIDKMKYQKEEISEILYVDIEKLQKLVNEKDESIVEYEFGYPLLFAVVNKTKLELDKISEKVV